MILTLGFSLALISSSSSVQNKFEQLTSKPYFIDKTLLLETILSADCPRYLYISQPRRFGKTINLAMVEKFFKIQVDGNGMPIPYNNTDAYRIFEHLNIHRNRKLFISHIASYPVLSLSLLRLAKRTHRHSVASLNAELAEATNNILWNKFLKRFYQFHRELFAATSERDLKFLGKLNSRKLNRHEMENALFVLCRMLYHYFGKTPVMVLIDDYDEAALNSYRYENSNITLAYDLISKMILKAVNQGPKYIQNIILSGVTALPFSHTNLLPSKVAHMPFLEDHIFTPFYGLSRSDLFDLFNRYECDWPEKHAIRKYYKAYQTLGQRTLVYNTYSLTRYFINRDERKPGPQALIGYWKQSELAEHTMPLMKSQVFRHLIKQLLTNRSISYKLSKIHPKDALVQLQNLRNSKYKDCGRRSTSLFFRIYFELGYLAHGHEQNTFIIPNVEVRQTLKQQIRLYQQGKLSYSTTVKVNNWVQQEASEKDGEDSSAPEEKVIIADQWDEGEEGDVDSNTSGDEDTSSVQWDKNEMDQADDVGNEPDYESSDD